MSPRRLEAFSDGVIAIAITLLVLGIRQPVAVTAKGMRHGLGSEWPEFLGYAISFLTIGIVWVNHHALVQHFGRVTRAVLYWNIYLLAWIAFVPFTTGLLTENLGRGNVSSFGPARTAAVVYNLSWALAGTGFLAMWRYLIRHPHLREAGTDVHLAEIALRRSTRGPVLYLIAAAVSAVSAVAGVVLAAAIALSFMFGAETDEVMAKEELTDRLHAAAAEADADWERPAH